MNTSFKLYIASKSPSRHALLKEAGIPFMVIEQSADESQVARNQSLQVVVEAIARLKMQHAYLPQGQEGERAFVLTADTMGVDYTGNILGKPRDLEHAIETIRSYRHGAVTGTAVCIERRLFKDGQWHTEDRDMAFASATYAFDMPDEWIEQYVHNSFKYHGINCLEVSGGVAVEGFGAQFIKNMNGSHSAVIGLPMYEVRCMLQRLGFYN